VQDSKCPALPAAVTVSQARGQRLQASVRIAMRISETVTVS
jgi:hypothetical protein